MAKTKNQHNLFQICTTVYLWLMLTVFLFWCTGYQNVTNTKFHLFLWLSGGYVIVMAALAVELRLVGAIRWHSPLALLRRSSWTQRLMLVYLLLSWVSALASPHFPQTLLGVSRNEGVVTITLYVLCFLLVSVYGRADRALLWLTGAGALAFSALCIVQMMGFNPLGLYPAGYNYHDAGVAYSGAYLGTIGNVDLVAAYVSLAVPILWVGLLRLRGRQRWLLLLPLAAMLAVTVQMSVMAGLLGVIGCAVLALPVVLPASDRTRKWLGVAVLGGIVAAVIVIYFVDLGGGLLHEVHALLHGRASDSFGTGRVKIWRNVLERVPSQLWLGSGPDTMMLANLPGFSRYDPALGRTLYAQIDVAHSEYLNILFHQGAPALLAYLAALACAAKRWLTSRDHAAMMLGAAVLGYSIQASFGFSMCITAPFFWLALALLETRTRPAGTL